MNSEEFERMLRDFLAQQGIDPAEASQFFGAGLTPADLAQIFSRFSQTTADGGSAVDWDLAKSRALDFVKKQNVEHEGSSLSELATTFEPEVTKAFKIASLWLAATTDLSATLAPKSLSRELWVMDAMPLFQKLAEPIAEAMANALGENLGELLPEEFAEFAASANSMLRRAGASLFALQLGSALGQFALDALVAGEVGIPISERPGVVIGNALLFSRSNGLPEDQVLLYLALRELALHSLFTKSTWLRDQIVNQVREYAAGLRIDAEQLRDFAANASEISGEELAQSLSAAGLIAQRSEGQLQAMERIEFMLALIEGWVESTAQEAGARLPALPQISEAIRRRRAVGGIGEKTFETLLGLELRPRLLRETAAMWVQLNERIGRPAADQLWSHPDLLPSPAEVIEPEKLVARLRGQEDELDKQLRDLLD